MSSFKAELRTTQDAAINCLSHATRNKGLIIRTTRIAGGLLLGYNPRKAGARLKTPAFTLFRPYCP